MKTIIPFKAPNKDEYVYFYDTHFVKLLSYCVCIYFEFVLKIFQRLLRYTELDFNIIRD